MSAFILSNYAEISHLHFCNDHATFFLHAVYLPFVYWVLAVCSFLFIVLYSFSYYYYFVIYNIYIFCISSVQLSSRFLPFDSFAPMDHTVFLSITKFRACNILAQNSIDIKLQISPNSACLYYTNSSFMIDFFNDKTDFLRIILWFVCSRIFTLCQRFSPFDVYSFTLLHLGLYIVVSQQVSEVRTASHDKTMQV